MKMAIKRLILAVCAVSIAAVAMAAIPKARVEKDPKDARTSRVVVTSPEGDSANYRCQFAWQISFNDRDSTDACEVDVPAGTKDAAMCVKQYDKRISEIVMVQSSCKPI
ncbi:MAG TPA: hypothetical protein VHW25_17370 [Steroidobacteraceae bacterium]|jgi:hypothetical protein|nr:hypothetical protein [Steroidobacteraceae bacterium]